MLGDVLAIQSAGALSSRESQQSRDGCTNERGGRVAIATPMANSGVKYAIVVYLRYLGCRL